MLNSAVVFQIYFDARSKSCIDPGFEALDNSANERPDWREYWPIRQWTRMNSMTEDAFYGFLSWRFYEKTGLTSQAVFEFANQNASADVLFFSPGFDQLCSFLNVFEHGSFAHPELAPVLSATMRILGPNAPIESLVMHTGNSGFCNFFLAKPRFWRRWLQLNNTLFDLCETPQRTAQNSELANCLRADVTYADGSAPAKVFVMERMAPFIAASEPGWAVDAYNPFTLKGTSSSVRQFDGELVLLDALKRAYTMTGQFEYAQLFQHRRLALMRRVSLAG